MSAKQLDQPLPPDLEWGAFSEVAPWVLDESTITWNRGLSRVRARTHAQIPGLVRPPRLPNGLRSLAAISRVGGALAMWALKERRLEDSQSKRAISQRLRVAFAKLGPTYVKLGQIISSGQGLFPEELVEEFSLLRDRVPPEPFEVVRSTLEAELGRPIDDVFASFDRTPLAAASIAQVHKATLRHDDPVAPNAVVVVKVQRPNIDKLVRGDIATMAFIAPHAVGRIPVAALANPPALVELFAETIIEELDFRLEAENMLDVARVLASANQRALVVPRPHPRYVTKRVLVMQELSGFGFDDVDAMRAAGVDTEAVLKAGLTAVMEGALLFGVFHGDLHGGNLFVQPDGRTALLDYGITGRMSQPERLAYLKLIAGSTTNDVVSQVEGLIELGALPRGTDVAQLIADLNLDQPQQDPTTMSGDQMIHELQEVTKKLLAYGARLPKVLMLLIKDMVFLDGAIATLAPDLDVIATFVEISTHFAATHGERLAAEIGVEYQGLEVDPTGLKNSLGLDHSVNALSHRELQERRKVINERLAAGRRRASKRSFGGRSLK